MTDEVAQEHNGTGITEVVINDPIPPASGADEQKPIPGAQPDETGAKPEETPEQVEAKKLSRRQRQLTRERDARVAAETETRLLREQLAKAEQTAKPAQESNEPKRENFADYESYLEARADWRADQKATAVLKADREARQGTERQQQTRSAEQKTAEAWTKRETAFQAEAKDYADVVTPFVEDDLGSFSEGARRAIVDSDVGPQLLYHLAGNSELVEKLAGMTPARQIAELVKIEDKLAAPVEKKSSSAPPPIKPVQRGGNAAQGYRENMTDAEYREFRKGTGARWAR